MEFNVNFDEYLSWISNEEYSIVSHQTYSNPHYFNDRLQVYCTRWSLRFTKAINIRHTFHARILPKQRFRISKANQYGRSLKIKDFIGISSFLSINLAITVKNLIKRSWRGSKKKRAFWVFSYLQWCPVSDCLYYWHFDSCFSLWLVSTSLKCYQEHGGVGSHRRLVEVEFVGLLRDSGSHHMLKHFGEFFLDQELY